MFDTKENIHNDIQVTAKRKLTFLEWGLGHRGEKNYETVIHTSAMGTHASGRQKMGYFIKVTCFSPNPIFLNLK